MEAIVICSLLVRLVKNLNYSFVMNFSMLFYYYFIFFFFLSLSVSLVVVFFFVDFECSNVSVHYMIGFA
ncbi:hypothetical protein HanRHA438_Chr05g0214171 [Helianthus annuus]|nr:hypothetical protein HanRHA438_Chr05g0214171 [Helianthus annuus]